MSLSWVSDHISSEFDEKIAEAVDNRRELEEVLKRSSWPTEQDGFKALHPDAVVAFTLTAQPAR